MTGRLAYSVLRKRMRIVDRNWSTLKELHCGDALSVYLDGAWQHTRIELDADGKWYLDGIPSCRGELLEGLTVTAHG